MQRFIAQGYLAQLANKDSMDEPSFDIKLFRGFEKNGNLTNLSRRIMRAWRPVALPFCYNLLHAELTNSQVPSVIALYQNMQKMAEWCDNKFDNVIGISPTDITGLAKMVKSSVLSKYKAHCGAPFVKIHDDSQVAKFHAFVSFSDQSELDEFMAEFNLPIQTDTELPIELVDESAAEFKAWLFGN